MRRFVALVAGLAAILASRAASADDPHDLFGLGKRPAAAPPPSCDEPHTFGCATVTDPLDDSSPYGLTTWLSARYLRSLPVGDATHDGVAHYALGASRDEAGLVLGGATGLENRWTIEGAPADHLRTGAVETRVPLTFLDGIAVMAGGFTARDRTSLGGTIDARLLRGGAHHTLEASVWAGIAGTSRRRPIASGYYYTRRLTLDAGLAVSASVVGSGPLVPLAGGTTWYAAGVAPSLGSTDVRWEAARLVDRNSDGVVDGYPGTIVTEPIRSTREAPVGYALPAMARVGWDRGPHHVELTLIGHANHATRLLANATQQAAGVDRDDLVVDGIATWRGRWKTTRALVQLAWHRSDRRESAHDPAAEDLPQLLSAFVPMTLAEDPLLAQLCHDGTYPAIPQCAVPFGYFASGGAGPMADVVGDRPTATAEIAHRRGGHVLRAGATLEDSRLVTTSRLSGGVQLRSLFDGHLDAMRYVAGECEEIAGGPCALTNAAALRYRTRYTAAYVEDTFSPTKDLRVDGGVRWELMWVGERLHFSNQLAPRTGLSWDVLGQGRSRVFANLGRSYAMLPAGLGATVIRRDATVHDITTPLGDSRDLDRGAPFSIAPGIAPMSQDEVTLGVELGLARTFRVTGWVQGRYLRRGLETTSTSFDNPGRRLLEPGLTEAFPARRSTEQLALEVATAPTGKLTLRAGYLVGRTVGNFIGAWDPRQGVTQYDGDEFDTGFGAATDYGRLPTDTGHRVFVEADRKGSLGGVGLELATRLTLGSGRPRNALGITDVGLVNVLERGSVGRGPMTSSANVRLAAHWRGFDVTLDVFNLFDHSVATNLDEIYTESSVRPVEGGDYSDLVFLKDTDGVSAERRTGYGLPLAFQSPISAVLGIHRTF